MGWFWADQTPSSQPVAVAPHPIPRSDATPPPACPMHKPSAATPLLSTLEPTSACPYVPPASSKSSMQSSSKSSSSTLSKLNPLNYMPQNISQERAANQTVALPVTREASTIPKGDGSGNWEYPSPQQMYNAMLRKGYTDTPQDAVESMVAVHNFLNEGAWAEIVEWERRFSRGLKQGWRECRRGEEGSSVAAGASLRSLKEKKEEVPTPRLVRFMGRPDEMTPKARMLQFMGWLYPAKFGTEPPFDRHDWFVARQGKDGGAREVRYVIDYYSGPPEPTGEPVFYLDVRPAVDGPTAALERAMRWGGDVWWRASGGAVREAAAAGRRD